MTDGLSSCGFETELYQFVKDLLSKNGIDKKKYSGLPVKDTSVCDSRHSEWTDDAFKELGQLEVLDVIQGDAVGQEAREQLGTVDAWGSSDLDELEQVFSKVQVKTKPNTS